jgi:hypothetical protein
MRLSARLLVMATIAVVTASAVVVVPSVRPPAPDLVASPAIRLSVAVQPLTTRSDNIPSLADEIQMGIVPSLGAPLPTPPTIGPSPAPTGFEDAIKNTYSAIEPWVRYGFELATYAVGWIPWVGWLAPQIMIFYNFGERIVRSLVFNSADWLWGPLPFFEGLGNVAQDSWNALVQLGIDQWNFWLPSFPLPPLPFAAAATGVTAGAVVPEQKTVSEEKTLPGKKTLREEKTVPASRDAVRDAGAAQGRTVKSEVTTPRAEPQATVRGRWEVRDAPADTASAVSAKDARDTEMHGADGTKKQGADGTKKQGADGTKKQGADGTKKPRQSH